MFTHAFKKPIKTPKGQIKGCSVKPTVCVKTAGNVLTLLLETNIDKIT